MGTTTIPDNDFGELMRKNKNQAAKIEKLTVERDNALQWKGWALVQQAQLAEMRGALEAVKQACLFSDDDGNIGVTTDPHISAELFNDVCQALATDGKAAVDVLAAAVDVCRDHGSPSAFAGAMETLKMRVEAYRKEERGVE